MSVTFMSSVLISTTFGRFCLAFRRRSCACFCRRAPCAASHLAVQAAAARAVVAPRAAALSAEGAPRAPAVAQARTAAEIAASENSNRFGLPLTIGEETLDSALGCGLGGAGKARPPLCSPPPKAKRVAPTRTLSPTEEHRDMAISKVGVVGCGLMGHGISQICAQAG